MSVFEKAEDQAQVCYIQSVDILALADLMKVSKFANESWDNFLAFVSKFSITQ